MYIVLYNFTVKLNKEEDFIKGWKGLTKLIYQYQGSLGSRLHIKEPLKYMAYAQWPDKLIFEDSGKKLPKSAKKYRDLMRKSCDKIELLSKFKVVEDLLINKI